MDEPEWFKWMAHDGTVCWVRMDSVAMLRSHPERDGTELVTHSGVWLATVPMAVDEVAEKFFGIQRE